MTTGEKIAKRVGFSVPLRGGTTSRSVERSVLAQNIDAAIAEARREMRGRCWNAAWKMLCGVTSQIACANTILNIPLEPEGKQDD